MRSSPCFGRFLVEILVLSVAVGLALGGPHIVSPLSHLGRDPLQNSYSHFKTVTTPCPYVPYPVDLPVSSRLAELLANMTATLDYQFRTTTFGTLLITLLFSYFQAPPLVLGPTERHTDAD